ncbi:MAG: peptidylprolyl isomerase [Bdellovibrionales bacterium]
MMRARFFAVSLCVFFVTGFLAVAPAHAQRIGSVPMGGSSSFLQPEKEAAPAPQGMLRDGIAVVVNDDAITHGDVRARLALALMAAGMPDTPEARAKIFPQVLRALIEEQLIMQEAKKIGAHVPQAEVNAAIAHIAQENKVPNDDMKALLASKGIPFSTMYNQTKGALAWNQVVMREIRPRIEVSDEEIEAAVRSLEDNAGKQEYLVSEIFLAVDQDNSEEEVKAFANKLFEQISAGAVFSSVARQFSQGTGASAGGDIGWIRAGELAAEVDKALQGMEPSSISKPIRSGAGYHIIGLRDKRIVAFGDPEKIKVTLGQVFKRASDDETVEALLDEAVRIKTEVKTCEAMETALSSFNGWKWKDLGTFMLGDVPSWLASTVESLKEGEAGEPIVANKTVLMVYMCDRDAPLNIDKDEIRQAIGVEKMQRISRGFLRDLRRDAFIDIRLKE